MTKPHEEEWRQDGRWVVYKGAGDSGTVANFDWNYDRESSEVLSAVDEARARLASKAPKMARALLPIAEFVMEYDRRKMLGLDDEIYAIHSGRGNGGASIFVSELRAALEVLREAGVLE